MESIGRVLSENCRIVTQWMEMNKFKLNADKTHILTVGTGQRLGKLQNIVEAEMDGVVLGESGTKFELLLS